MTAGPDELPGDEQTRLLAQRYSLRAQAYDSHWSPIIRPLAERVLEALPLASARLVLDLGTGAGALLPRIRSLAPSATVLGVDRSAGMVRLACEKHGGPLALMDAQRLGLRTGAFDVAVLAFMLFHLPEPRRALSEANRVLRKAGVIAIVTWAPETMPVANGVWDEELEAAGAVVQKLPATDQKALFDSPAKLSACLEQAGFVSISAWRERFEHNWSPEDHFEYMLRSNARWRLESLTPRDRQECLSRVRRRLRALAPGDYLYLPDVVFATAST